MAIAIVILLLVIISVVFHLLSPWWLTPIASNWGAIDDTINITFWITGVVFVAVNGFLAYSVFRYRYNKNRRAHYEPENKKLEIWLTLLTTLGVAGMLAPGLLVWDRFVAVPAEAKTLEVVGQQWQWSFRLPGKDGILGKTAIERIDVNNPFGIDIDDANGGDDILVSSNELHVLIDQPVKVLLRSKDVLHNFAVPQFRVKMDLVPGIVTYLWFTPTRLGRFEILCEELCGMAHYTMRGHVVVDSAEDYQRWLSQQLTFTQWRNAPSADIAKGRTIYRRCMACHGESGEGNYVLSTPQLAGQDVGYLRRQLSYYRNQIRGSHEQDSYGQQMALMAATLANDEEVRDVAAYIGSLPTLLVGVRSAGDITKGRALYGHCAYCHGINAEGKPALNAPKLVGQHSNYLKRQLENFRSSLRGAHQEDLYGRQMLMMSRLLQTEEAVIDVVAYINTLLPEADIETRLKGDEQGKSVAAHPEGENNMRVTR